MTATWEIEPKTFLDDERIALDMLTMTLAYLAKLGWSYRMDTRTGGITIDLTRGP